MKRFKSHLFRMMIIVALPIVGCNDYIYDFEDGLDKANADSADFRVDISGFEIDKSMYDLARIFPGLVDEGQERIQDTTVIFNLDRVDLNPDVSFITVLPKPILSTGLYAGPGELVEITVPDGVYGITAQVGIHTEDLTTYQPAKRAPLIYTVKELFPGVNRIRNPFGGYIWFKVAQAYDDPISIKFKGALRAPDFILGTTDPVTWKQEVLTSAVPWMELRAPHITFSVSKDWVERAINSGELNNLDQVMQKWESIMINDLFEINNLKVGNEDMVLRAPDYPVRVVQDIQLEGNVYIQTLKQPLMVLNDQYWFNEWSDFEQVRSGSSWATLRELGKNFQRSVTPWWSDIEESAPYILSFKVAEVGTVPVFGNADPVDEQFQIALNYAATDTIEKYINAGYYDFMQNPLAQLTPLIQMLHKSIKSGSTDTDGWDFYGYLHKRFQDTVISDTDFAKQSFLYYVISDYTGRDYLNFFRAWGIPVTDYTRGVVSSKYPPLDKAFWEYDPITRNGGDAPYSYDKTLHVRTNWTYSANSIQLENAGISGMKDGNPDSYWHSCYSSCEFPPSRPHVVSVDMGEMYNVSGIFFQQRRGPRRPMRFVLYTSVDNSSYDSLTTFELENVDYNQYLDLPGGDENFRYFRVFMPDTAYDGTDLASIAELGTYEY